jgi:rfaE bifunctional protein nucleotidyltransferase chain/domain
MHNTAGKIYNRDLLAGKTGEWRKSGEVIVFTNGCFDIIHLGHVDYLEKARNLGSRLVVGVNTDASIRRLKGDTRPVQDELSRSRILASFEFVDAVCLFDEDTPYELIKALNPHILVKGNDYSPENIVGSDIVISNGGRVMTIELVPGYSTSEIINKIKK